MNQHLSVATTNTHVETVRRQDLQALRGIAVILVVLYHADFPWLKSGYLGVDIFFVLSGFLITGVITRGLDRGTFRFIEFYWRRARRLFPAAYVVILAASVLAPYFLTAPQMAQFRPQVIGALTFRANVVLWQQSGYFDLDAVTKPLLHFWSLAIEEQYYFVMPALLVFTPRRLRIFIVGAITLASLIYCFAFAGTDPSAKFYLLTSRAWELGLGSLGALLPVVRTGQVRRLSWLALAVLIVVPFIGTSVQAPAYLALAICFATLVLILNRQQTMEEAVPVRGFAWVGDWSYSIYLVHWPVFAFLRGAYLDPPPPEATAAALALSFGLAYALFHFVERPIREARVSLSWRHIGAAVACSVLVYGASLTTNAFNRSEVDYTQVRSPNYGLAPECDQQTDFVALPACATAVDPTVFVWGDSHAMQFLPTLERYKGGVEQGTRSACAPFLKIAPYTNQSPYYTRERALSCIAFNDSVMRYLEGTTSIKIVVLAAALSLYRSQLMVVAAGAPDAFATVKPVASAAKTSVDRLRAAGKTVVFAASAPYAGFNIGACLERRASALVTLGKHQDCTFSRDEVVRESGPEFAIEEAIAASAKVSFVRMDQFFCTTLNCDPLRDGVVMYVDGAHLTRSGAELLGNISNYLTHLLSAAK